MIVRDCGLPGGWGVIFLLSACMALGVTRPAEAETIVAGDSYYAPGTPVSGDFVLGPSSPGKWGSPVLGTGAVVTWSLMPSGSATEDASATVALSAFMPVGFHGAITAAFAAWSAVADITFIEVADDGADFNAPTASGDIRIAGTLLDGAGATLAHGYYPPLNGLTAAGDIHFDTGDTWKLGFGGAGFNIFQVAAHEIGHAIGLNHTGVAASLMNPFYTEAFIGPQLDDIAGAQFIYGPAPASSVPEPASTALLVSGLLIVAFRARRRDRSLAL